MKKLVVFTTGLVCLFLLSVPSIINAQQPTVYFSPAFGFSSIQQAFSAAVRWSMFFAILLVGLLMIGGGIMYITASDDPKKAEAGRGAMINAAIGFVIIASVYLILKIMTLVIPGLSQVIIL